MNKPKTMETSYWGGTGKYQNVYDKAWDQLVPPAGEADTSMGKAFRAIGRVAHDYYNNGFCNLLDQDSDYGMPYITRFYDEMIDNLAEEVPTSMVMELRRWCKTIRYANIDWHNNGDEIIEEITDLLCLKALDRKILTK